MQRDLEQPYALARLLRELPDEALPPYGWGEFRRRAEQPVAGRDRAGTRYPAALAALAAITVGIVALSLRLGEPPLPGLHLNETYGAHRRGLPLGSGPDGRALESAHSDSRAELLERWLASVPDEPALVRVGNRAAVTGLEDCLAELDDLLTLERVDQAPPEQLSALQRERRQLVSSLAQVRYAQTLAAASPGL